MEKRFAPNGGASDFLNLSITGFFKNFFWGGFARDVRIIESISFFLRSKLFAGPFFFPGNVDFFSQILFSLPQKGQNF